MAFDPKALELGGLYTRPELALMWGYASHEAISRGVVTPAGGKYIILFVTRQKQVSLTQYRDFIGGDCLHWEGEKAHRTDSRIARARNYGEEIHLFYRDIHHTRFRYHGEIRVTWFVKRTRGPSRFVFRMEHDLGPEDDLARRSDQLSELGPTEYAAVVRARRGQGQFRDDLFDLWGGCAVSGVDRPDLLRASHIKPWRSSSNTDRLNRFNGLLLLPHYDHLFDRGYITFDGEGRIEASPAIINLPPERLGIEMCARLRKVAAEHAPFLEYHRREVFLKRLASD